MLHPLDQGVLPSRGTLIVLHPLDQGKLPSRGSLLTAQQQHAYCSDLILGSAVLAIRMLQSIAAQGWHLIEVGEVLKKLFFA